MNDDRNVIFWCIIFFCCVFGFSGCYKWYAAGVQTEVYNRQGIHMTQWEVFTGATPAERLIHVK